jgi:hypothetical protein
VGELVAGSIRKSRYLMLKASWNSGLIFVSVCSAIILLWKLKSGYSSFGESGSYRQGSGLLFYSLLYMITIVLRLTAGATMMLCVSSFFFFFCLST